MNCSETIVSPTDPGFQFLVYFMVGRKERGEVCVTLIVCLQGIGVESALSAWALGLFIYLFIIVGSCNPRLVFRFFCVCFVMQSSFDSEQETQFGSGG
jgi:hypothetical protein